VTATGRGQLSEHPGDEVRSGRSGHARGRSRDGYSRGKARITESSRSTRNSSPLT
jgi:hypothetical protein